MGHSSTQEGETESLGEVWMERGRDGEIEKGVEGEVWMKRGETERLRKEWREKSKWRRERRG